MGLSPAIVNQLSRAHYTETQQLLPLSDEELRGIRGIGADRAKTIRECLSALDLTADERLDRVRAEADEKIRVAAEAADQKVERANATLAEAQDLVLQAQISMEEVEDKAQAVLSLEPLLKGEKLVREYYLLRSHRWEWPFQGDGPRERTPAAVKVLFTLSGHKRWIVLADIKGDSAAILKELVNDPVLLEDLRSVVVEAQTAADKLSELSSELWPLIEPVELARQFMNEANAEP